MLFNVQSFTVPTSNRPNEDAFTFKLFSENEEKLVAAIADGVGGNVGGGVASSTSVNLALELLTNKTEYKLFQIFEFIKNNLIEISTQDTRLLKMATTLTLLVIEQYKVKFGHVGDTRLYHLRSSGLKQKTKDQTEVALLVEQGVITPRKAKNYPRKSVLISALSASSDYSLQQGEFEIEPNDRLLLLSDGVYNVLPKRKICDISLNSFTLLEFKENLINELLLYELNDDATLILIEVCES